MLYEGIIGIQVLDLLGCKVMLMQGVLFKNFIKIVYKFCKENVDNEFMVEFIVFLLVVNKEWGDVIIQIGMWVMVNQEEIGVVVVDYLMYSGYIMLVYFWVLMVKFV